MERDSLDRWLDLLIVMVCMCAVLGIAETIIKFMEA